MFVARKKIEGERAHSHIIFGKELKARSSGCLRHQALRSSSSLRAAIFHKPQSLSDGLYCSVRESLFLFFSSALLLDFSHFFSPYFKRISYHKRNPPSTLSIYAFTSVKDMHARIYINCYDTHIYRSSNKLQKSHQCNVVQPINQEKDFAPSMHAWRENNSFMMKPKQLVGELGNYVEGWAWSREKGFSFRELQLSQERAVDTSPICKPNRLTSASTVASRFSSPFVPI